MNRNLQIAGFAGAFLLVILLVGYLMPQVFDLGESSLIALDVLSLIVYVCYIYGFVVIAKQHRNQRFMYAGYAWIISAVVGAVLGYFFVEPTLAAESLFTISGLIMAGSIIFVGWMMTELGSKLGMVSTLYGICAMLVGALMLAGNEALFEFLGETVLVGLNAMCYAFAVIIFLESAGYKLSILKR